MSKLNEKQRELEEAVRTAKTAYAECETATKAGKTADADTHRTTFENAMTAVDVLKADIAQLRKLEGVGDDRKSRTPAPRSGSKAYDDDPGDEDFDEDEDDEITNDPPFEYRAWGQSVVCGPAYRRRSSPDQPIKMKVGSFLPIASKQAARQQLAHIESVRSMPQPQERRAIYASTESEGGYLVPVDIRPGTLDRISLMPLSLLDLVNVSATDSDTIQFIIEDSMTNNAAVVPEWDTVEGDFALKPESDLGFSMETTTVKQIATYVRASRRIMRDAPRLRGVIDNRLPYMLRTALEGQILSGSGVGNNFLGILNTPGTLGRIHQDILNRGLAADTIADTIRRAISDVYVEGFPPDVIVVHPFLGEALELLKDDNKQYLVIFDPVRQTIWRVPVVYSLRMAQDVAIVGNFGIACTLYDRQQTEIRVGEPNDLFLKNAIAILAELAAAFAVEYPKALNIVTDLS